VVRGLDRRKLLRVRGFKLESYYRRFDAGDHWAIVRTRMGKKPDDEWIEVMLDVSAEF
jgi:hypothetical protein